MQKLKENLRTFKEILDFEDIKRQGGYEQRIFRLFQRNIENEGKLRTFISCDFM